MLDALTSLAFSVQSSKGVYALLLGSGISRSAKIPTGWEITVDLVRKAATARGEREHCEANPVAWYVEKSGKQPDYADLLEMLGRTPEERQRLVQSYIEPTPEERARKEKVPTPAHRAIAKLVAAGYIRVLITTNFDRLLELALQDEGVHPTVISSTDHIRGAVPLVHAGCVVIKVHGDYLDTRIRNTPSELDSYDPAMDALLDRVFDEFGLIVCGWSADWDVALKAAITRTPSRRFSMYWAARGTPSGAAQALIAHRGAQQVSISGADEFFDELAEKVNALEAFNHPHPLSEAMAVAMLKEYLPEPRHRIRLADLINRELRRTLEVLDGPGFPLHDIHAGVFEGQVKRYETAVSVLVHMAYAAGRWSSPEQTAPWRDVIITLAKRAASSRGGMVLLIDLMRYPAVLVLYAFGLGAVAGGNHAQFRLLTSTPLALRSHDVDSLTVGDVLNAASFISDGGQGRFKMVEAYKTRTVAASDRIADVLRPVVRHELVDEAAFDHAFACVELVLALGYAERHMGDKAGNHFWAPTGRYVYQDGTRGRIVQQWRTDVEALGQQAPLSIMAGLAKPPCFDDIDAWSRRIAF